jgi:VWFA-related protein
MWAPPGQLVAQTRVTVSELQATLTADHAAGRKDADEVLKLADMAPSERVSSGNLASLQTVSPGPLTTELLRLLAEASVFLPPPAADVAPGPSPTVAEQRAMLAHTVDYVKSAISRLPDFLATRNSRQYIDSPHALVRGEWAKRAGLHLAHIEAHQIGFRDGHDSDDPAMTLASAEKTKSRSGDDAWEELSQLQQKRKLKQPMYGLSSWGEFGPILQNVLVDAARSNQMQWARWENGASGKLAVFSYKVTEDKSHYPVHYCCIFVENRGLQPFHRIVPYKGEITVDPVNGTIMRVTLDAQTNPTDPVMRAAIMVEYGPVEINSVTYTLPTRSVALSLAQPFPSRNVKIPLRLSLNEVNFRNYHKFAATVKMLTDEEATAQAGGTANGDPIGQPVDESLAQPSEQTAVAQVEEAEAPAAGASEEPAASAEPPPTTAGATAVSLVPIAAASTAPSSILPEVRQSFAKPYPDFHLADDPGTLKADTRLVDVGIGFYDKHGHALRDVKPEEIQILDNGRPQKISFFAVPESVDTQSSPTAATPVGPATEFTNHSQPAAGNASSVAAETNTTVLLIDEENLAWADLQAAKRQMLEFLKKLPASERVALYTMDQFGFHVLVEVTANHTELIARLERFAPNIQSIAHAEEAENRNRQHFDWVRNVSDLAFVNGNRDDNAGGGTVPDPQLRDFGEDRGHEAVRVLIAVARHLAAVPGHKALIWVTSDNALAEWRDQQVGLEKQSLDHRAIVLMAANLMNDAHVSVYPLDASQLEGGAIEADLRNRNIEVTQGAAPPVGGLQPRNMTGGRATAEMHADMHAIEGSYRDLAADTGGRAIRRASDMVGNLEGVYEDSRATYVASFSPDTAPDGKYHKITVELPGRKGVSIHSRTGYLFLNENTGPRSRFEAVAWQPGDSYQIGLTAQAGPSPADGAGVSRLQLKVQLRDLAFKDEDGRARGKVDIYLLQRDEYTGQAHSTGETIDLALKPETRERMQKSGFSYGRAFKLDARTGSIRMIVVDETSGKMGSLTISRDALVP